MFAFQKTLLSIAAVLALSACGGNSVSVPEARSGTMIDGYVVGATVFCDLNGDGIRNDNESVTTTVANGKFSFQGGCAATVVGSGGKDGERDFIGVLKAPAGATVITPLTTLLSWGLTEAELFAMTGVPAAKLLTLDFVAAQADDPDAFKAYQSALMVQQMLSSLAVLGSDGGNLNADFSLAAQAMVGALRTAAAAPGGFNLLDTTPLALQSIMTSVAANAGLVVDDAALAAIATQAQRFADAEPGADLGALAQELQPVMPSPTNFFSLKDDALLVNVVGDAPSTPLSTLQGGLTIDKLETLGMEIKANGTLPASSVASVALQLIEVGGTGRKLQIILDTVNVAVAGDAVSFTVPVGAKVFALGQKANGDMVELELSGIAPSAIEVNQANRFKLNYQSIVDRVLAEAVNNPAVDAGFSDAFLNITGSFDVALAVSGINLRMANASALESVVVNIDFEDPTSTDRAVIGVGATGRLIITGSAQ